MREIHEHFIPELDDEYRRLKTAFHTKGVSQLKDEELVQALQVLGANRTGDDSQYVQDGIQALAISHMLLRRTIDGVEERSKYTTKVVILLALVSVLASLVQIGISLR